MSARRIFSQKSPDGKMVCLYGKEEGDQEIHVDGAWGLTYTNGVCKINLYSLAPTSPDENEERREVVARLVVPVPTVPALRDFLADQYKRLEEAGFFGIVTDAEAKEKLGKED